MEEPRLQLPCMHTMHLACASRAGGNKFVQCPFKCAGVYPYWEVRLGLIGSTGEQMKVGGKVLYR